MKNIQIKTTQPKQILNITDQITQHLPNGQGIITLFTTHTTCALTTADLDPGTDQDYLTIFNKLIPELNFNHPHDPSHFPDHFWSSVIGPSLQIPYENKQLILGTWQRVVLVELNGPRERKIIVKI